MKRMDRHWDSISADEIFDLARKLTPEDYASDWMADPDNVEFAERVLGQELFLAFDDGTTAHYAFTTRTELSFARDGEAPTTMFYRALSPAQHPEVVIVHHYCDGMLPPTCIELVLDFETGYCVCVEGTLGTDAAYPRNVESTITFGEIAGATHPEGSVKPSFTQELVGKAISWAMPAFTGRPPMKHIYLSPKYYAIFMIRDEDECYQCADPADYIKIKDDLYLVVVTEHRRSGMRIAFLIDTNDLHDIGCHFGISAGNEVGSIEPKIKCSVMTGRTGTFVPMETVFKS